ncbi:hypothetical protein [Streptomyces capitiformicae]|uniref:DUF3800 domain-containing protein n=1 Tax=Streptomyces capitiformicae TaxID=2014920 RepID=A0A919GKD6_9ACTN|nr:hypothetical protein [Streptomyces capitiformicae]GHH85799.1 hypothetical protein GCM10017771_20290 [Streptomyces capitiformicae]
MTRSRTDPTGAVVGGRTLEVACDESGSDGENLTTGNTDVFAHGSVLLPMGAASAYVQEVRDRIRSPAEEYKANILLREKHRAVLQWYLGPSGPIHGHAHVHLTEKPFFVVDRVVALLTDEGPGIAVALHRQGRAVFGSERWREFLEVSNDLLRTRKNEDAESPVEPFFRTVDALRRARSGEPVGAILDLLARGRARADAHRARILAGPELFPVLNPLMPAIVHTSAYWRRAGLPVTLVHDRQNMLTEERIARIEDRARLAGLRLVPAGEDPRILLADFLAGTARKIASDELNGRGDPELTTLLRPYVSGSSVWGDERSWAALGPDTDRTWRL